MSRGRRRRLRTNGAEGRNGEGERRYVEARSFAGLGGARGSVVDAGATLGIHPPSLERKELREALYSGIFRKYRKTILVVGSFLRLLRKGDSNYGNMK